MKKRLAILLALVMLVSLAACGDKDDKKGGKEEPAEPVVQEVTIGDYHVVYNGAYEYGSNEFGSHFIVLIDFTNNADQAYKPNTRVYIEVKQDGKLDRGIEWQGDKIPNSDLYGKDYEEVAPGESISYYNGFNYNPDGGVITVTIMDNFHQIEDKLVIEIDPATLTPYEK